MNMFRSTPFFIWVIGSLFQLRKIARKIKKARNSKDDALEQQIIREAEAIWGPKAFSRFGTSELIIEGAENLPEEPLLFVSNHQGYGDIIVFLKAVETFNRQIGFVAKSNLGKIPLFGPWVLRVRSLLINRGDARSTVKKFIEGEDLLRRGFNLVIFPEGTRSHSNELGEFKHGSLHLAIRSGAPIVPVTLMNSWRMWEEKGYPQSAKVRMYFHPPVLTEGLSRKEKNELTAKTESIIRSKLDEWQSEGTE